MSVMIQLIGLLLEWSITNKNVPLLNYLFSLESKLAALSFFTNSPFL